MRSRQWWLALFMTCGLVGLTATASDAGPIRARERHQQGRIMRGLRSGQLTGREFRRLEGRQGHIARLEARLRLSGGVFTRRERAIVRRALHRQSRFIFRQRHDRQRW